MRVSNLGIRAAGRCVPTTTRTVCRPGTGDEVAVSVASRDQTPFAMAEQATRELLHRAGLTEGDLERQYYLVCNEGPGDYLFQLAGRMILDRLGVGRAYSYNFTQGGNSPLMATYLLACHLAAQPEIARGIVAAPQHWEYHSVGRLLGDAALGDGAAVVLFERGWPRHALQSIVTRTDGRFHDVVYNEVGGWRVPMTEEPCRAGRCVYRVHNTAHYEELAKSTVDLLAPVIDQALEEARVGWSDVDQVVFDAATPQLRQDFLDRFRIPEERAIDSGMGGAWMCSAGLLLAFGRLLERTDLRPGSTVLATSVGIDGNWAAAVIRV
ncbi:MAG: hypothetical protein JXA67_08865 [Micromonosporaceae bacterium]|nr:hypothetical protein [Micromonosporaceae bacterium]